MKYVFGLLLTMWALSAYAADYTAGAECPTEVHYKPADNLNYQAGLTASGYGVAPADEAPAALSAEDFQQVSMALEIPVSEYIDSAAYTVNDKHLHLNAGQLVTNSKTGEISINGRDISSVESTSANPDCW